MKRNAYFDFLRGIAIMMVVAIHTFRDTRFEMGGVDWAILIRQTLNAAVPIFLAISGYFLSRKSLSVKSECLAFWKKQLPRVYIPCFIWSLPPFALSLNRGGNLLINSIQLLFCGYSIYYFVLLIMQYYVLLPFLKPVRIRDLVAAACFSCISIMTITYFVPIQGYDIPLVIFAGPFPLWIVFFVLGIYLAQIKREYSLRLIIPLLFVTLLWEYTDSIYLLQFNGSGLGIKLSSFAYSFLLILLLFSKHIETWFNTRKIVLANIVTQIGGISFGIYLTHCHMIILAGIFFKEIGWAALWAIVMFADVCMITLGLRLFPNFSRKYLGFT